MEASLGNCVICCYSCKADKIGALPCGHTFHFDCVVEWVKNSKACPICRVRCIERNVIKQLFFNFDVDQTVDGGDDELERVRKELLEKKNHCETIEKNLKKAEAEAAANLKERVRWQTRAAEGEAAVKQMAQMKRVLNEQRSLQAEILDLRGQLKASEFYKLVVAGASEDKLKPYITSDGNVNVDYFLTMLQKQITDSNKKLKKEQKRREEAEASIVKYKRLVQELRGKDGKEDLVERLNQISGEKRISFGGETSTVDFSDSFLGSAMRPAPRGRICLGGEAQKTNELDKWPRNTLLDVQSMSRIASKEPSPEIDAFDVVLPKKVTSRLGARENMSNGMGGTFSMKNSFDRLSALPLKENAGKPYERAVPKKKLISNNVRLSDYFAKKQESTSVSSLNDTIVLD